MGDASHFHRPIAAPQLSFRMLRHDGSMCLWPQGVGDGGIGKYHGDVTSLGFQQKPMDPIVNNAWFAQWPISRKWCVLTILVCGGSWFYLPYWLKHPEFGPEIIAELAAVCTNFAHLWHWPKPQNWSPKSDAGNRRDFQIPQVTNHVKSPNVWGRKNTNLPRVLSATTCWPPLGPSHR